MRDWSGDNRLGVHGHIRHSCGINLSDGSRRACKGLDINRLVSHMLRSIRAGVSWSSVDWNIADGDRVHRCVVLRVHCLIAS